jgi:formylglycine-generating enzyme required for sulfatase activity
MVKTPSGTFSYGTVEAITPEAQQMTRKGKYSVSGFYMSNHEVTNREYNTFLAELKKSGVDNWEKLIPDTTVWRDKLSFGEPYMELYFQHPAYNNYPVIGVSHEQAKYYCEWLTERYNQTKKRKYTKAVFRLPTENEWSYAAMGGWDLTRVSVVGNKLRDEKGQWAANFKVVPQWALEKNNVEGSELIAPPRREFESNRNFPISETVKTYPPNAYGLYNMSGNVEEMVSQVGVSKGGSWEDTGFYLQIAVYETYGVDEVSKSRGFRVAMYLSEE